jgi:hypothetical protein
MTWFGDLGLSFSANQSEMMVFPGNMKILRFRYASARLHFEMSLNLNIWEYFLTDSLLGGCMRNISSEDATQGLIL